MSLLINGVLLEGEKKDILIQDNRIEKISSNIDKNSDRVISGQGKVALPSFFNLHTHAAMTLMRGYSDDLPVQQWLEQKIWPLEEKLTSEDVYWGTKLACLEMIKTGTTFFNDMYWYFESTAQAVEEMGIRASLGAVFIDLFDEDKAQEQRLKNEQLYQKIDNYSNRIQFNLGPHSIYTVSAESLEWAREFAEENDLMIHIHLAESKDEIEQCQDKFGKSPVKYLDEIGFLGSNVIAAHCVWLDEEDIQILAANDVKMVHLPASNMKLASGTFPYERLKDRRENIALGTDGSSSNNNLDMFEEMKIASLLAKIDQMDPTEMPADQIHRMATKNGAEIFDIKAGIIEEGKLADLILVDLNTPEMTPDYNTKSNIVYSANGSCVDTTICNGQVLMESGHVEGEEKIITKLNQIGNDLITR